ncbi:putative Dna polymerase zeta catalytic subunit [Leptomonas pyrrhocoris]|uniref:DNA polymerase zeta catalytic subunit n=1 Tax=Leptomonas pyrrhocoris TaxID=157538 RepID=A0A0N0DY78_LEPPY|nr:putative Dna polymerase zeta catalytic subunit [Leptomonas pyrrhocoris]KPA83845.1 putative Dna polymerase zeta catalytic subunit [Leptomonas pyrrhocoris]|eukprot:XP_015662284.1 putative Dna polymerase zeta catalytic subunit [Leptomonas pyrrhocoris]
MYFQVVSIAHSLEKPQEELGDVTLSPVFRRVSARCPVLHLFGYVHIPSAHVASPEAPSPCSAAASSLDRKNSVGRHWHNEPVPLATLLEPAADGTTPSAPPPPAPSFVNVQAHTRPAFTSPSPKLAVGSVRVAEPSEESDQTSASLHRQEVVHPALAHTRSKSKEAFRSSALLRLRYTQRRACLHVHGFYPSLLLPQYNRSVSADQLAAQLETVVLRVLSKQGVFVPGQQLVHDVRVVHRYNVYGYRPHAYAFYLVELVDPNVQQKVMEVLQSTREVGGRQWQLYDAHMKYHTQFMVHWRINGIAPFPLPVPRCHVRLPTAAELRHRFNPPSSSSSDEDSGGSEDAPYKSEWKRRNASSSQGVHGSGVAEGFPYAGLPFQRFWRPDELDRLTTAEVEMDVCARDLGEPGEGDAAAAEGGAPSSPSHRTETADVTGNGVVRRGGVSAGDNLSYTRRSIRRYFKEHGVADALRVADTIAVERHRHAAALSASVPAREDASASAAVLRYGNVVQIQRADPTVQWMRHRMLEYLEQRRASAAAAAAAANPSKWKAEGGDDDDAAESGLKGVSVKLSPAPPLSVALVDSSTVPFAGLAPAMTAAQQQEQRAIRAQMVAEYSKPGGGHRRHTTVQTYSERRVLVPALQPTFAEMGADAVTATGRGSRPSCSAYGTADNKAEQTTGNARYIGFSADSLQLSPSQDTATPSAVAAITAEQTAGFGVVLQPWLRGMSAPDVKEVEMAATQDLMAALVARSSVSLGTAEAEHRASSPHPPVAQGAEKKGEEGEAAHHTCSSSSAFFSEPHRRSQLSAAEEVDAQLQLKRSAVDAGTPPVDAASDAVDHKGVASQQSSWFSQLSWSSDSSFSSSGREATAAAADVVAAAKREKDRDATAKSDLKVSLGSVAQKSQPPLEAAELAKAELLFGQADRQRQRPRKVEDEEDVKSPRDLPTQNLGRLSACLCDPISGSDRAERHGDARLSPLCFPRDVDATTGSTPPLSSSGASEHQSCKREAGVTRQARCCSSPRTSESATTRHTVGDCVAFVRVHPPHQHEQFSSHAFSARGVDDTTVCEVLAAARIAQVAADTVALRWFLQLSETHLAEDEAALVRRGAWIRRTRCMHVPRTPNNERPNPTENPVQLGEMLLGDAVDVVPASVLEEDALPSALAYAAARSAPTQRLLVDHDVPHKSMSVDHRVQSLHGAPHEGRNEESEEGTVHVWPVHCCIDAHSYRSCNSKWQRRRSQFPPLRILCRYQYVIHARVLTAVTSDLFTSSSVVPNPRRLTTQDRSFAGMAARRLHSSKTHSGTVNTSTHPSTEVAGALLRSPASRPSQRSSTHPRTSRVLFTQPERLTLSDDGDADVRDGGKEGFPVSATSRPPLEGDVDLELGTSRKDEGAEEEDDAQRVSTCGSGDGAEGEGEDTLLFPSSASSSSSSSGGGGPPQRMSSHKKRDRKRARFEGVGSLASSSAQTALHHTRPSQLLRSAEGSSFAANPSRKRRSRGHYRVSTLRMPAHSFMVGAVRIQRSVHADTRHAADVLQSQEQLRWRRYSAAMEDEDARRGRESSGVIGPAVSFSNASLVDEEESIAGDARLPSDGLASVSHPAQPNRDSTRANEEAQREVLINSSSASSSPLQHTVRDTADVARDAVSSFSSVASADSAAASEASSVEAVGVVTASQRTFLQLFRQPAPSDAKMRMGGTVLQTGGSLGPAVDGVPRWFRVTASACGEEEEGEEKQRRGGVAHKVAALPARNLPPTLASDGVRMRVSAVTWPYMAPTPPPREGNPSHHALYEPVEGPQLVACTSEGEPAATAPPRSTAPAPRETKSASHVPALSLSLTQQPQHHLQCLLRVQYLEVLLNRRPGEALVSTSNVLAVALGQASTAADGSIGIRVFRVAPTPREEEKEVGRSSGATKATPISPPELPLFGLCSPVQVVTVSDEAALLTCVRDEILAYDPDVLLSWEGYKYGLGYLALRYRTVLKRSLAADLSRIRQHHGYPPRPATTARTEGHQPTKARDVDGSEGGRGVLRPAAASVLSDPRHLHTLQEARRVATGDARATNVMTGDVLREAEGASAARVQFPTAPPPIVPPAPSPSTSSSSSASSTVLSDDVEQDGDEVDEDDAQDGGATPSGFRAPNNINSGGGTTRIGGWRPGGGWGNHHQQQQQQSHQPYGAGSSGTTARSTRSSASESADAAAAYSRRFGANVHITGRICTSFGKDLRKDVKMPSYALPMVHAELFGQPLPYFTDTYLAALFHSTADPGEHQAALRYLATRVAAPHRIACKLHWFTKLLEFSRMYGILTEEVLTRGSQFRVEATLLRLAHPLRYAMLSPSLMQVHRQPRIECIPLVMQPKADLYRRDDPIVVLDFRSLYPSIIIAYNLCYTTCLGMVQPTAHGRLGVLADFTQPDSLLAELLPDDGAQHDGVVFTPNGAMFVATSTRVGLLPQMVQAVLDTRFEVQASFKHIAVPMQDTAMQQRLQEQQLALKMLANVTYGYTAASFTGRMPCVDLAEAIVSLGRQTLERAVALIHSTAAWRAEVVYGDTDSLFVRLHGRTLSEAFIVGQQMADAVTQSNPSPIRLQFEKVLSPCLLLVKKRYAGYMWTSPTQTSPTFLAKGIEVVRRDQCPATAQLVHRMLRLLFDGCTAATLKHVYYTAMEKVQAGAVNPLQCIFRRAVKLGRYGRAGDGHLPLAARLALAQMETDVTETPYWGERLPYVVVRSTHSIGHLTDQVLHPAHLLYLQDKHSLDASYYITRNINSSLDRMFYLVGISFAQWYQTMPRRRTAHAALLNLPTFMKAQEQQVKTPEGSRPPSAPPPPPPPHLRSRTSGSDPQGARLHLASQLALHMQQLLRETIDPLFLLRRETHLCTVSTAVISDDDDNGEADAEGDRRNGSARSSPPPPPVEVEDLTRPTVHEFVDVEQLMATQRAGLPSAAAAVAAGGDSRLKPPRRAEHSHSRRRRCRDAKADGSGVTLDTFYPRTLCIVCEKEAVSLDDVRRQREVLQRVVNTLGHGAGGAEADGGGVGEQVTRSHDRAHAAADGETEAGHAFAATTPLQLPPICTRCWSDPCALYLHVQARCCTVGRQLDTLHHICANCIGSGGDWGAPAHALFTAAMPDMEDMDAFSPVRVRGGTEGSAAATTYSVGSVSRHLLFAAQLSARGVPHGCVSIDCAVGFEKKWVTEQWQQWQAVQRFLRGVM